MISLISNLLSRQVAPKETNIQLKADQLPLNVKAGEVLTGKVLEVYPNKVALLEINGKRVVAELQVSLKPGQEILLQAQGQKEAGLIQLKLLAFGDLSIDHTSLMSVLKEAKISLTSNSLALVQAMMDAEITLNPKTLKELNSLVQNAKIPIENFKQLVAQFKLVQQNTGLLRDAMLLPQSQKAMEVNQILRTILSEVEVSQSTNAPKQGVTSSSGNNDTQNPNLKAENANVKPENANLKAESANVKLESLNLKAESANVKPENSNLKAESANVKPESLNLRAESANVKPENLNLKAESANVKPENANLKAESANVKSENANLKAESATVKPENANLKAESATVKPENANLKAESANVKPENANMKAESLGVRSETQLGVNDLQQIKINPKEIKEILKVWQEITQLIKGKLEAEAAINSIQDNSRGLIDKEVLMKDPVTKEVLAKESLAKELLVNEKIALEPQIRDVAARDFFLPLPLLMNQASIHGGLYFKKHQDSEEDNAAWHVLFILNTNNFGKVSINLLYKEEAIRLHFNLDKKEFYNIVEPEIRGLEKRFSEQGFLKVEISASFPKELKQDIKTEAGARPQLSGLDLKV